MLNTIGLHFGWPGINKQVEDFVKTYDECKICKITGKRDYGKSKSSLPYTNTKWGYNKGHKAKNSNLWQQKWIYQTWFPLTSGKVKGVKSKPNTKKNLQVNSLVECLHGPLCD